MPTAKQQKKWRADWRTKQVQHGLCSACGREPLLSTLYGLKCLKRIRNYYRKRKGFVAKWYPGKGGTIPYEYRTGPVNFPKRLTNWLHLVKVNGDGLSAYYKSTKPKGRYKGAIISIKLEKASEQSISQQKNENAPVSLGSYRPGKRVGIPRWAAK